MMLGQKEVRRSGKAAKGTAAHVVRRRERHSERVTRPQALTRHPEAELGEQVRRVDTTRKHAMQKGHISEKPTIRRAEQMKLATESCVVDILPANPNFEGQVAEKSTVHPV